MSTGHCPELILVEFLAFGFRHWLQQVRWRPAKKNDGDILKFLTKLNWVSFSRNTDLLGYINTYLSINALYQYQWYQYGILPGSPSEPSKKDGKLGSSIETFLKPQ